jgi:hypothetical protein
MAVHSHRLERAKTSARRSESAGKARDSEVLLPALGEFTSWEQTLSFWKTADKREVDFVSYGPLGLFAFEIKRNAVVRDQDLDGLRAFASDYPMAERYLLYGGDRETVRDGIRCLNFEQGLRRLPEIFSW